MLQRRFVPSRQGEALHQEDMGALVERVAPHAQFGQPDSTDVILDGDGPDRFLPDPCFDDSGDACALDKKPGRKLRAASGFDTAKQLARLLNVEIVPIQAPDVDFDVRRE